MGRRESLPDRSHEGEAESATDPERDDPTFEGAGPAWPPLPVPVPPIPKWMNGRAFTAVWRDTLLFTAGGLMAAGKELPQLMPGAGWKSRPEPDSERDVDQAIAAKSCGWSINPRARRRAAWALVASPAIAWPNASRASSTDFRRGVAVDLAVLWATIARLIASRGLCCSLAWTAMDAIARTLTESDLASRDHFIASSHQR